MVEYNHEFQVIDTPEKAYVLGFIYSDGCIVNSSGSYAACITQKNTEEYLIDKIQTLFPFFRKVRDSSNPTTLNLVCTKKAIYKDLLCNGVYPRKSDENRFNLRFPNLPKELQHHFVRGYFDGDGSVYKQKVGNTKFEIGGSCYYFITDLIKILYDNRIEVNLRCRFTGKASRTIDFYVLYASSDKVSKQFANYIYKDCGDLYMKRKHDKLFYIPEYHKLERYICPNCGGTNTIRGGSRIMSYGKVYRGYCKDCKKQFTITAPTDSNNSGGEDELLED